MPGRSLHYNACVEDAGVEGGIQLGGFGREVGQREIAGILDRIEGVDAAERVGVEPAKPGL